MFFASIGVARCLFRVAVAFPFALLGGGLWTSALVSALGLVAVWKIEARSAGSKGSLDSRRKESRLGLGLENRSPPRGFERVP